MRTRRNPARNWLWTAAALFVLAVAVAPLPALARQFVTLGRISVSSTGIQGINIQHPVINGDGNIVAFWSDKEGLVPSDTNFAGDVFVRIRSANQTIRVSLGHGGVQTARTDGNLPNSYPEIDIDDSGCIIVYSSDAQNITQVNGTQVADANNTTDVFAVDRCIPGFPTSGFQTLLVSRNYGTGQQANSGNTHPKVSGTGQFILWRSAANNLVTGDNNNMPDIFVMDRLAPGFPIARVNLANNEAEANIEDGTNTFSISDNGMIVAFASVASNLTSQTDNNGWPDIFIRDRPNGTTTRIMGVGGAQPNGPSSNPDISGNGEYVVFRSDASNLITGDTNGHADIFRYHIGTGTIERVSVSSEGAQGSAGSDHASVSDNGRWVSFFSDAPNLVFGDTNGSADIFVRDMDTDITTRAHVRDNGAQANGPANRFSALNDNATIIAFESYATNLADVDTNATSDVFVGEAGPNSPNGLTVTDRQMTSISLQWNDNSGGEDNMVVQRRRDDQAGFNTVQTLAANSESFTDSGLTSCTVYHYRVQAVADDIKSSSNIVKTKTLGCPPGPFNLQNPTNGELVINPARLEFRWQASEEAVTYHFNLFRVGNGSPVETRAIPAGSICDVNRCILAVDGPLLSDLTNANYTWTVAAQNPIGTTNASNNAAGFFTVNTNAAPRAFAMYTPVHRGLIRSAENVTFTWEDSRDAAVYRLDVVQVSNNVRLGSVIDRVGLTPGSDADGLTCDFDQRVCSYEPTSGEVSAMDSGKYTWTVFAVSPGGTPSESPDGAFRFTLNTGDIELLTNGGFEADADANKVPDGWTLANKTNDSLKCNKPSKTWTIHGECAFEFRGGANENSALTQKFGDALGMIAGDEVQLGAQAKATNLPGGSLKLKLTIKYVGNAFPADKLTINVPGGMYDWNPTPTNNAIINGAVANIQVKITNSAASGKVTLDNVSLLLLGPDSPRRRGVEGESFQEGSRLPAGGENGMGGVLPPPPPPIPGFRGQN